MNPGSTDENKPELALTETEQALALCLVQGMSDAEAARALKRSPAVIAAEVDALLAKMGYTRAQLAEYVKRSGKL